MSRQVPDGARTGWPPPGSIRAGSQEVVSRPVRVGGPCTTLRISTAAAAATMAATVTMVTRPPGGRQGLPRRRTGTPGTPGTPGAPGSPARAWASAVRARLQAASSGPGVSARNRRNRSISSGMALLLERPLVEVELAELGSQRRAGPRQPRPRGALRDAERGSDLLVAEVCPRVQQQDVSLIAVQRRECPRDPRRECCRYHPLVGSVGELGGGRRPDRVTRQPGVQLEQLLLVPPLLAHHVGGNPVQPGPG